MESCLNEVIQQLEQLIRNSKALEEKYLGQVLALERIVNNTQKSIPQVVRKQTIVSKQKEEKKEDIKVSVQSEVNAFLNEIQIKQKSFETEQKPKFQIKPPEIVVQKKPPLPTINRSQKTTKHVIPAYIPPRNKNDVTGKVTQNTIRTSAQKTFKPQIVNSIRSNSKQVTKIKDSGSKTKTQIQVRQEKRQSKQTILPKIEEPRKTEKSIEVKVYKTEVQRHTSLSPNFKKEEVVLKQKGKQKLQIFQKEIDQLFEQFSSKGTKNRKTLLQKMIKECQNEQMGHKKNEEQSRFSCIKQINNYAHSRGRVIQTTTHRLQRSRWNYNPELFELQIFLNDLQNQFSNIQNLKQFRIDAKQQYRMFKSFRELQRIVSQAEEKTATVPDQLELGFHYNPVSKQLPQKEDEFSMLSDTKLNQKLSLLLDSIEQSGSLQKTQLRCLQVLGQIGIYKSKKTPIVTMSEEFQGWKSYYFNNG